jgi:hypothetical protein
MPQYMLDAVFEEAEPLDFLWWQCRYTGGSIVKFIIFSVFVGIGSSPLNRGAG